MEIKVEIKGVPELMQSFKNLEKQITYAAAQAINETAKQVKEKIARHTEQNFNIRTPWLRSNAVGIGIKWATKSDPFAIVENRASWMQLHEPGGIKTPHGKMLAVPVLGGPKRTKRDLIRASQKPRALLASGKGFIVKSASGQLVIFARDRKKGAMRAMYLLEPQAKIMPKYGFVEVGMEEARQRIGPNFDAALAKALATAK